MAKQRSTADETRASIQKLIIHILAARGKGVEDVHLRSALDTLLWKYTEADGKQNTRYCSAASMGKPRNETHHEHVYQKKKMIDLLMASSSEGDVRTILENACGCIVTRAEHELLKPYDGEYGWARYSRAGIIVIDRHTGQPFNLVK
jgi:hypothetical protein